MRASTIVSLVLLGAMLLFVAVPVGAGPGDTPSPTFADVSGAVGLGESVDSGKYWTPLVTDFDRDGNYDLVLGNHGAIPGRGMNWLSPELYWGRAGGTFEPFDMSGMSDLSRIPQINRDYHGFSAGYLGDDSYPDMLMTLGGSNGTAANSGFVADFTGPRSFESGAKHKPLDDYGITGTEGRGRSAYYVDLDSDGDLDVVVINRGPVPGTRIPGVSRYKFVFERVDSGQLVERSPDQSMSLNEAGFAGLVDLDHNGVVDLLYMQHDAEAWLAPESGFAYEKSSSILPVHPKVVRAAAEIDYDGDGDFDLYLARGNAVGAKHPDFLLEWDEDLGRYVDVTSRAFPGINLDVSSDGVTVGDLNNDGFSDIFVSTVTSDSPRAEDRIFVNQGDGTFALRSNHGATVLGAVARDEDGNQAEVFDFDGDGRVDILSGSMRGPWRLFNNRTDMEDNDYVSIRVGNSVEDGKARVPLGAKVTVMVEGKDGQVRPILRRVGSQGQSHSQSFMDTLHFGLGEAERVVSVEVAYGTYKETTTFPRSMWTINTTLTVGSFPGPTHAGGFGSRCDVRWVPRSVKDTGRSVTEGELLQVGSSNEVYFGVIGCWQKARLTTAGSVNCSLDALRSATDGGVADPAPRLQKTCYTPGTGS